MKRFVSILLLLALLLGCLPVSALAADGEGYFYFSAESDGLIVAPMKVPYTKGQSIRDALTAAGIRLGFSGDMLSTVNETSGNYQWLPGDARLDQTPTDTYFCIYTGEQRDSIGDGWKALMQQLEAYPHEEADVRQAAKTAYENAYKSYPGADDAAAGALAAALETAISDYKTDQNTRYSVTFSQFSGGEYSVYAVSAYGKRVDAENGVLSLPNGAYTFYIYKDNKAVSGSLTVNGSALTVRGLPDLPTQAWIDESAFQISTQSGIMSEAEFESGRIATTQGAHGASAVCLDTFTGGIYPYVKLKSGVSDVSLSAIYTNATGKETAATLAAGSRNTALYDVLSKSAKGSTVIFRASQTSGEYKLLEDFTLTLDRTLTLSGLTVKNAKGEQQPAQEAFSGTTMEYTYRVLNTEETLDIYPAPAASDVTVTVDGEALNEAGYASVTLTGENSQQIAVELSAGTYETTYTLTIERDKETTVKVTLGDGVTELVMLNRSGEELEPSKTTAAQYTYKLIANEMYTYRATRGTYFHAERTFQLTDAWRSFTAEVPSENMPSLSDLRVSTSKEVSQYEKEQLALLPAFASEKHNYTTTVADTDGNIAAWAEPASGASCTVYYSGISKTEKDGTAMEYKPGTNTLENTTSAGNVILTQNAYGNTLTFNVAQSTTDVSGTTIYSTDYVLTVKRALTLQNLEISGATLDKGFSGAEKSYTITVPAAQRTLSLTATAWDNSRYIDTDGGYELFANGNSIASGEAAEISLSGDTNAETVTVTVGSRDKISDDTTYTINVQKAEGSKVVFNVQTSGALLYIFDKDSGSRVWPNENGSCSLFTGYTYGYSVTKQGYVGTSGYFQLEDGKLVFGTIENKKFAASGATHDISEPYSIGLSAAPESSLTQLNAEWPSFRGNPENNGVTTVKTPISAEDGTLYWAVKAGNGYGNNAVGSPILVGGYLYANAGTNLLKIDKDTGKVLASGEMVGTSSFSIVPPTYAEGMILVGLAGGCVQAFNAETLQSLWVYYDPLGGQPNSPITVHDGRAYTGFWNSETKNAAFVCLSLTDEKLDEKTESKPAAWRHVQKGGFYWAGAYACDAFVMVGTDDGDSSCTSATANLLLLEPETGRLLDSKTDLIGDIRSSICYDKETNAYYFTTKGGYFYSVKVSNNQLTDLRRIDLGGMSTSTPVVANGRAYVGVSGASQFGVIGHNITVIDLGRNEIAYRVPTNGYPQASGLLTTAYGDYNYVYFFDNMTPGTLRLLRDRKDQTAVDATYQTNEASGIRAYALFTPADSQAQYCICSPIIDENGTLYFKNDSGYMMAFGSAIEELVVTKQPNKTHYNAGERFDATGLAVTAKYKNGLERDVTRQISFKTGALEEGETAITLIYGSGRIMYHNVRNADGTMRAGEPTSYQVQIPITVGGAGGTVFGGLSWGYSSGRLTLSGTFPSGARLIAAAYDNDGRMTGTKLFTTTDSAEISGAKIRLFLLDAAGRPLCEAVTAVGA